MTFVDLRGRGGGGQERGVDWGRLLKVFAKAIKENRLIKNKLRK